MVIMFMNSIKFLHYELRNYSDQNHTRKHRDLRR